MSRLRLRAEGKRLSQALSGDPAKDLTEFRQCRESARPAASQKASEGTQWGIVTDPGDNAFDGVEAVTAIVPCSPPTELFTCGGEADNYGDFFSAVRAANLSVLQILLGNTQP